MNRTPPEYNDDNTACWYATDEGTGQKIYVGMDPCGQSVSFVYQGRAYMLAGAPWGASVTVPEGAICGCIEG